MFMMSLQLNLHFFTFLIILICCHNGCTATFAYGCEKVRGVNLGGWLVLEPWIRPSLFEQFVNSTEQAVDEYTFTKILGYKEARRQLRNHWDSWVTEDDISTLASYGLNYIRIPVGYWAYDKRPEEPFVQGACFYLLKAVRWAKKYNMKVVLDLHGAPGSQNGFDNSGRRGPVRWQTGDPDNISRTINVIRIMTKQFSLPKFKNTVTAINVLNEPASWGGNRLNVTREFYDKSYEVVRHINSEILVVFHTAFLSLSSWRDYLSSPNFSRVVLDTHIYSVFDYGLLALNHTQRIDSACSHKIDIINSSEIVWTLVGEWCLADTDCTKWLNGFGVGARYDGTFEPGRGPICPTCRCQGTEDYWNWTPEYKKFLSDFASAQMDSYEAGLGWIFWNFKAEASPHWNFMLGVEQGWIPLSPKDRTYDCGDVILSQRDLIEDQSMPREKFLLLLS